MGWGRTLLLGDIGNQMDIQDTQGLVDDLRSRVTVQGSVDGRQDQRLAALERENNELKLYIAALARLLVRKGTLAQSDLTALVDGIDQEPSAQQTAPRRRAAEDPIGWENPR